METLKQAIKYGIVGLGNTVITASVIWIMMKVFGCSDILSNIIGYAFGVLNSFVLNKQWTFNSTTAWLPSLIRFGIVFGVCYLLQLALLIYLNSTLTIDSYYNQLIAMAFYTVINFLMNKFYTFRSKT